MSQDNDLLVELFEKSPPVENAEFPWHLFPGHEQCRDRYDYKLVRRPVGDFRNFFFLTSADLGGGTVVYTIHAIARDLERVVGHWDLYTVETLEQANIAFELFLQGFRFGERVIEERTRKKQEGDRNEAD